ncbi:MAG: hypothetical protein ABW185_03145 [Sedimenticola sp.]
MSASLDQEVGIYRSHTFAASTAKTYASQRAMFIKFCSQLNIAPVPLSQADLGRYIAFLSQRLTFASVRQYLNVVRLFHLEAGLHNPLDNNWYVASILKGVRRVKGDSSNPKLPITIDLLKVMFQRLDFHVSLDRSFWAACLVGFFSFFRKSNLLVPSHDLFDPARHLCASDAEFTSQGVILTVRWSKVIQFRQRILQIPLPIITDSPFCPSTMLLQLNFDHPHGNLPVPLFRFKAGCKVVPLTSSIFTTKLHDCLRACGIGT